MKPTYFFLLDFVKEMKIATGKSLEGADEIEKDGLAFFGYDVFTYKKILASACKTLAILEGVYLLLKKKKTNRQFRIFDGKKKFVTTGEVYDIYSEKFDLIDPNDNPALISYSKIIEKENNVTATVILDLFTTSLSADELETIYSY